MRRPTLERCGAPSALARVPGVAPPAARLAAVPLDPQPPTVDRRLVKALKDREDATFRARHPKSIALLERGRASMPNGVPMAWLFGRDGRYGLGTWGAAICYLFLSKIVIDFLVSGGHMAALYALTLLSWVALVPGAFAFVVEQRRDLDQGVA